MATLQADDIADLIAATQRELGRGKITDIASTYQSYPAMSEIMTENKVVQHSGTSIQFNVLTDKSGNARNVGLFSQDNLNQADGEQTGNVPWRHTQSGVTWDMHQVSMNRSPARIVNFVKMKTAQDEIDMADQMEENFWVGTQATTDTTTPYGLDYWLTTNSTEGFDATNSTAAGASGRAGIDSTTYTRWANFTNQYTNVTQSDLFRKLRKAYEFTQFKSPIKSTSDYDKGKGYGIYTTYDKLREIEEALEGNNDNLGVDIAPMDGRTLFRRIPIEWVPYLQENTSNDPVYGINWGVFHAEFLEDWYMRKTKPTVKAGQHNVLEQFCDSSYNFVCRDLRKNFYLSTS